MCRVKVFKKKSSIFKPSNFQNVLCDLPNLHYYLYTTLLREYLLFKFTLVNR